MVDEVNGSHRFRDPFKGTAGECLSEKAQACGLEGGGSCFFYTMSPGPNGSKSIRTTPTLALYKASA